MIKKKYYILLLSLNIILHSCTNFLIKENQFIEAMKINNMRFDLNQVSTIHKEKINMSLKIINYLLNNDNFINYYKERLQKDQLTTVGSIKNDAKHTENGLTTTSKTFNEKKIHLFIKRLKNIHLNVKIDTSQTRLRSILRENTNDLSQVNGLTNYSPGNINYGYGIKRPNQNAIIYINTKVIDLSVDNTGIPIQLLNTLFHEITHLLGTTHTQKKGKDISESSGNIIAEYLEKQSNQEKQKILDLI